MKEQNDDSSDLKWFMLLELSVWERRLFVNAVEELDTRLIPEPSVALNS